MKKEAEIIILLSTIVSLCLFVGCSKKPVYSSDTENKDTQITPAATEKTDVELELWSWFSIANAIKDFESNNSGIKIKEKIFNYAECEEEYMNALAKGEGPDILFFNSDFFGQFTVENILQNLLEEPFEASKYKDDFLGWDSGLCIDGKQLLSLTLSTSPYVTFYRADIMEENGFPSDPEEFGIFIEKPENLLAIGKKLKEQNKFIFEYPTDLTDMACATNGYFDYDFNFIEQGDLFIKTLDLAREAYDSSLFFRESFWDSEGKKAIQESKLVMHIGGSYSVGTLSGYAPDQKGKWKMAKAPLGITAWTSDTRISANIQSNHKEETWRFIEYIATHKAGNGANQDSVEGYIPIHNHAKSLNRTHPFLGDQEIYSTIHNTAINMVQYKLTPLNNNVHQIYRSNVWNSFNDPDSKEILKKISAALEEKLREDIEILKNPDE